MTVQLSARQPHPLRPVSGPISSLLPSGNSLSPLQFGNKDRSHAPGLLTRLKEGTQKHSRKWLLGIVLAAGAALGVKGCHSMHENTKAASVASVTSFWGLPGGYVMKDGQVTSPFGLPLGKVTADGKAYKLFSPIQTGEVSPDGVIYSGAVLKLPVARIAPDGKVTGYLTGIYQGKIEGDLPLQEKGAVALLTILKKSSSSGSKSSK